jgi:hypothetical protein
MQVHKLDWSFQYINLGGSISMFSRYKIVNCPYIPCSFISRGLHGNIYFQCRHYTNAFKSVTQADAFRKVT